VPSETQDIEKYKYFYEEYEKRTGEKIERMVFEKISATKTVIQDRELWTLVQDPEIKKL
jgi:hypothetical protein